VHYVRSGDSVRELLAQSQDANEYAFALGALAHYASDIAGHPAVNRAVSIQYPKLRARYGNSVRYVEDHTAHLKTEFGFDMVQVAKNRYASQQYHDFIGFQVSKPLLERTFPIVYGVELKDILVHDDLAIGSYRYSCQPDDSENDTGCSADSQERHDEGIAELCEREVPLSLVAL
jgi:Zinc dependent phospholipase C